MYLLFQQDGNPCNGLSAIMVKVKLVGQNGPFEQDGQNGLVGRMGQMGRMVSLGRLGRMARLGRIGRSGRMGRLGRMGRSIRIVILRHKLGSPVSDHQNLWLSLPPSSLVIAQGTC